MGYELKKYERIKEYELSEEIKSWVDRDNRKECLKIILKFGACCIGIAAFGLGGSYFSEKVIYELATKNDREVKIQQDEGLISKIGNFKIFGGKD